MSHALLLRLFLSPYFSISVAMHYLKTYPESIGISHYLCWRMKSMPGDEVDFYWPQICHLLLTYPSPSNALEAFIISRAEESTHSAMLTFWFMQAALRDLTPTRNTNPRPFLICQRVLHRCHQIIFGDTPEPSKSPYRSLPQSPTASVTGLIPTTPIDGDKVHSPPTKVKPHVQAAMVGMSVMLAATPAMPALADLAGQWAVIQGRRVVDDRKESRDRVELDRSEGADGVPKRDVSRQTSEDDVQSEDESRPSMTVQSTAHLSPPIASPPSVSSPQFVDITNSPSLSTPRQKGEDPFGQEPVPTTDYSPFYSVPEFSAQKANPAVRRLQPNPPTAELILASYSQDAQRQLLRSHYCRSEIRFLLLLEDISNRLLVVPKPARVSALRAELTSLNHNLPAEICMPLWCSADHSHESEANKRRGRAHSRIVRISPGDSVVLNSAERAPFLLHVEILVGDLDFDPNKRDNRELLKKIVTQEDAKKRKQEGLQVFEGFGSPMPDLPATPVIKQSPVRPATPEPVPRELEEMDLVEQLYGAKLSVRDTLPDLSESAPLRIAPRNKALDVAAWDRGLEAGSSRRSSLTPNTPPGLPDSPIISNALLDTPPPSASPGTSSPKRFISLEDYSERMRTAAVMLAQLNASQAPTVPEVQGSTSGKLSWIPGTGWIRGTTPQPSHGVSEPPPTASGGKLRLAAVQAAAIRERIMEEMMALEEERVERMTDRPEGVEFATSSGGQTAEDEGIVRRELNKADPSAAVFKESWTSKRSRIQSSSPWGHLANWDMFSVIVKTGTDLRQEQLATQLIERFSKIFKEEKCDCWVRYFRILITGETSGLVETITDAVSIHSIKKGEYARRIAEGGAIGHASLMDHFVNTYGDRDTGRFARAQRNFIKSLAGYSVVTFLLQIKDRHNGNILLDRDGHLIHIDFGFMLSNSPGGNMGFEAAPFKLPMEYVDIMGGLDSPGYAYFKKLFKEGFEAARKHSDSLIAIVELMQKDSKLDCFALFGPQTTAMFRDRFALGLTTSAVDAYLERLIVTSTGSNYTRLYDTFQYYSQGVL
ncbi:kinase-like domain-containing protein [Kockovaella imperatae]|uniref:1-phosphatidylinositol 4-kinase n=1 Tax=Kockovaella imperatae TaxID=4999 RepID=A0A1Y1U967_9TREE|nr:kinase-like domain-containing protein [Kockovaella imperatae]ORX34569.1 kinase-like domain-containing protein [Kockovaella imperatae]